MKICVTNFRGIADAEIEAAGITLITGTNGAGKTSTLQAIVAALTGETVPIDGLKSNQAARLMRYGSQGGEVSVATDSGSATVRYPDGKLSTTGTPPACSKHAAGLESILDLPTRDRGRVVQELLQADPTRDELAAALRDINAYSDKTLETMWSTITVQGWDGAHQHAKETGARLKGQWENVTGQQYGSKKAESWLPASWDASLYNAAEAALQDAVRQETEWYNAAIASSAVAAAEIERLQSASAAGKQAADSLAAEEKAHASMQDNRDKIENKIAGMPSPEEQDHVCPSCNAALSIEGGKIVARVPLSSWQKKERADAIAQARAAVNALAEAIKASSQKISEYQQVIAVGKQADTQLAKISSAPKQTGTASAEDCQARMKRAQDLLAAFQSKSRADGIQKNIVMNQSIIDMLAPTGLRAKKIAEKLAGFNRVLAEICTAASWKFVTLQDDMSVAYGGAPYAMLSESEQYRCRITLQAAIVRLQAAPMLLVDRADILDSPGRNGLIKLAMSIGVPSVIAMTISKREDVPAVSKIGGVAYWIENGTAVRL